MTRPDNMPTRADKEKRMTNPEEAQTKPAEQADAIEVQPAREDGAVESETVEEKSEEETTGSRPEREAAKYRRQLRDVEAERDMLRSQLETAQRTMVEKVASEPVEIRPHMWVKLAHGSDAFTLGGLDPAAVHDKTGALDVEAVSEALRTLHESRPDLFTRTSNPNAAVGPYVPTQGDIPDQPLRGDFAAAFRPNND